MEQKVSKPLLGLGILVVLVVSTAFIPASWLGIKPVQNTYNDGINNLLTADSFRTIAKDNNNDGTPDWKNLLQETYKTSAEATGETSVAQGGLTTEEKARLNDPNNLTSSFAKNVYVATAYMKQNNITDVETQQKTVNDLLDGEASKIVIKTYTENDIAVSKNEDRASLLAYRDAVEAIVAQGVKYNLIIGDMDAVSKYNTSKNTADLKPLRTKATNVDTLIKRMLATPVPPSAVSIHLLTVNRLSTYKTTLEGLSTTDTDGVRATLVARQYATTVDLVVKSLSRFDEYFRAIGIPFKGSGASLSN